MHIPGIRQWGYERLGWKTVIPGSAAMALVGEGRNK